MAAIPEFILRKLYVPGSIQKDSAGFSFQLENTFAPATVSRFALRVGDQSIEPQALVIEAPEQPALNANAISAQSPMAMAVGQRYTIRVQGCQLTNQKVLLLVDTREAGELKFTLPLEPQRPQKTSRSGWRLPAWLHSPLKAQVEIRAGDLIGEINPFVYGHFIEHLERCIYGGIWSDDGRNLRQDTLQLIQELHPPLIRYPGGNFASGYHWEDGIGLREQRPRRFDKAWNAWESNQVGTDEYLDFCARVGAEPLLVVNDGSGTPAEAAGWVAYCNEPAEGQQGQRRAKNGHPQPYRVRLWGVGNEVWGRWQIGHTGPQAYAERLLDFIHAMRAVDPEIKIIAVGDTPWSDAADDPGQVWNETVLRAAGEEIDYLSFHLYQPGESGWKEVDDLDALHHTVCAAPLDVEHIIQRMAKQIQALQIRRTVRIAFDEWNLWLTPPPGARSMHQVIYTMRDALYTAGMLNAFHRQCGWLGMANLAQLVNVLPAIVTGDQKAHATPIYYPFWMYQHMQPFALHVAVHSPEFNSTTLGNISAHEAVPYLDVTATQDDSGNNLTIGMVNRHPYRSVRAAIGITGFSNLYPEHAWLLHARNPLSVNTLEAPHAIKVQEAHLPSISGSRVQVDLPAASVYVLRCRAR